MSEQIWTIKDIIQWSQDYLKQKGSDSPRLDAELLLAEALSCRRLDLYLDHHKPLVAAERNKYKELIKRRAQGEPIAYIIAHKDFFGFRFAVDRHTLIPRPETELLVERVLDFVPKDAVWRGLDVGTGSGCIAISIKKHREQCLLSAWDVSDQALSRAAENAQTLNADLEFSKKDGLDPQNWEAWNGTLDFVVSNPPYIAQEERSQLSASVVDFEPQQALFAADEGLAFYKHFAQHARSALRQGGKIFLEVGYRQARTVSSILESNGWLDVAIHRDLSGHERVLVARSP